MGGFAYEFYCFVFAENRLAVFMEEKRGVHDLMKEKSSSGKCMNKYTLTPQLDKKLTKLLIISLIRLIWL